MPRFCAIALPSLRVEIARARELPPGERAYGPLAVVIARPGGAVQREMDLLGNTRLSEVSEEACALGVREGQTIAAARAKTADLHVSVVAEDAVYGALGSIAEMALAFGATTSSSGAQLPRGDRTKDVVWVDITGCAHLFGGEQKLAEQLALRVRAMGYACRVAIADGPRIAAAVATHAPARRARTGVPMIVPEGKGARAMSVLPLEALPLSDDAIAWLSRVGMRTVGDLQRLPKESLGMRLQAEAKAVMSLIAGEDTAPIISYCPKEVPEERAELEYGIESTEALLFVAKTLCDRAAARLLGRGMAVTRLELVFAFDERVTSVTRETSRSLATPEALALSLPAPLAKSAELLRVLRAKLESFSIPAPILAVTLRLTELVRAEARELHLFVPEAKAARALPRLVAELTAEIGEARVGVLELCDSWIPEERARLVPTFQQTKEREKKARAKKPKKQTPVTRLVSDAPEPTRLLPNPTSLEPSASARMTNVKLIARFEAIEWWRRGDASAHDFVVAWLDGMEEGALAWLEVDRESGDVLMRGWMD